MLSVKGKRPGGWCFSNPLKYFIGASSDVSYHMCIGYDQDQIPKGRCQNRG
jgi:hypothetical protein